LRGWLTEQLDAARQKVAELTLVTREVASLRIREADTRRDTDKAKEKLMALAERAHQDAAETERLRKERDELLQTTARLRHEHDDAHQWINDLLGEVEKERESKIEAKNVSVGLAVQVGQHRARIQTLEAEAVQ
jgi:uncharacterized coiled-coil DUF342 family protein